MAFLDQVSALADQYFKNGGMVAKFQEGGDVDDDYGTFGADELGASVEDTAASEDIGTRDDDEDIDFPDEFEVPDPDKYDYGPGPDDGGDGDDQRVVSETVLGDGPTAAEAIEAVRGPAVDPAI